MLTTWKVHLAAASHCPRLHFGATGDIDRIDVRLDFDSGLEALWVQIDRKCSDLLTYATQRCGEPNTRIPKTDKRVCQMPFAQMLLGCFSIPTEGLRSENPGYHYIRKREQEAPTGFHLVQ